METTTADVPPVVPVEPPAAPAGVFDAIDWKNPVPGVMKLASHLESLHMFTATERLTLLQGTLLHVIGQSKLSDSEKEAAVVFVNTMLPHVVETAVTTLRASAQVHAAEKKAEEFLAAVDAKQPTIVVKNVEAVLADAAKLTWRCW